MKTTKGLALSQSKGFTLIELLMFIGIFSILLLALTSMFGSILDAQVDSKAYSSVDLDGRYVLAKLAHDFQSADSGDTVNNSIDLPATGSAGQILKIKINSQSFTYSASTSGSLQIVFPVLYDLTSSDSSISALLFQRIGPGTNKDTIKVNFRLTSKIKPKSGPKFKDFETTLSMP